jgi:hypothetical protein
VTAEAAELARAEAAELARAKAAELARAEAAELHGAVVHGTTRCCCWCSSPSAPAGAARSATRGGRSTSTAADGCPSFTHDWTTSGESSGTPQMTW